jgi:hypothetical protein
MGKINSMNVYYSINKYGENDIATIKKKKDINYGNLIISEDNIIITIINGNCFDIFSLEEKI